MGTKIYGRTYNQTVQTKTIWKKSLQVQKLHWGYKIQCWIVQCACPVSTFTPRVTSIVYRRLFWRHLNNGKLGKPRYDRIICPDFAKLSFWAHSFLQAEWQTYRFWDSMICLPFVGCRWVQYEALSANLIEFQKENLRVWYMRHASNVMGELK